MTEEEIMNQFVDGTYRCREPAQTLGTLSSLLAWCGIQRPVRLPAPDAAVEAAAVSCGNGSRHLCLGAGATRAEAEVCAAGIALELWHGENAVPPASVTASRADAKAAGYQIAGTAPVTTDIEMDWVEGWTVSSRRRALAPRDLVLLAPRHRRVSSRVASRRGLAVGNTRAEAITHALCELPPRAAIASGPRILNCAVPSRSPAPAA
jgi:ribosomal protein S12 methylthiotransferase accessory factor